MNESELEGLLRQLESLGGVSRSLSEAKSAMHNSDVAAKDAGETSSPGAGTEVIQVRREAIRRKAEAIRDQIIEEFDTLQKNQSDLIVNQFITNGDINQDQPWSGGLPVEREDLRVGDVVDIKPESHSNALGLGVRGAEIVGVERGPTFWHQGEKMRILLNDEVYLVHRPKRELPTEPGSWIEVTGYEGSIATPFKACRRPIGFWYQAGADGGFTHCIAAELITDFHELELTRKEDA